MLRLRKKLLSSKRRHILPSISAKTGQVAIVLILVIAIALIFYAVAINFGKLSETKTITTIASNVGASQLGSQMASYGQNLFQTQLGGKLRVCDNTSVLEGLIAIGIILIVGFLTGGFGLVGFGSWAAAGTTAKTVGLVLAVAAVAIDIAVIQPGITDMWNKATARALTLEDNFLENGISTALQAAVTDNVVVPDAFDSDQDGLWGWDPVTGEPRDYVNRFALYYNQRILSIKPRDNTFFRIFQEALKEFVYDNPNNLPPASRDNWGLYDPVPSSPNGILATDISCLTDPLLICNICHTDPIIGNTTHACCNTPLPSECNGCCLPDKIPNPNDNPDDPLDDLVDIRPNCCDCWDDPSDPSDPAPPQRIDRLDPITGLPVPLLDPLGSPVLDPVTGLPLNEQVENPEWCGDEPSFECGTAETCDAQSPYGVANLITGDSESFPFVYDEFYENSENGFFSFREKIGRDDEHRWYLKDWLDPNAVPQSSISPIDVKLGFNLDDTTGYYVNPPYISPPSINFDNKIGIFPFFYKIQEWGVDLDTLDTANPVDPQCHWCDALGGTTCDPPPVNPAEIPQLVLPQDPTTLLYNDTFCVDGISANTAGEPPLAVDKVILPGNIVAALDVCAQEMLTNPATDGFWKSGGDMFCSVSWPYHSSCPKDLLNPCTNADGTPSDCECTQVPITDRGLFPEDPLDDLVYGLTDFLEVAESLAARTPAGLARDFKLWYPLIAEWIEPASPPAVQGTGCFICDPEDGLLIQMRDNIFEIMQRLINWKEVISYEGATCEEVWCVPPAPGGVECAEVPVSEAATFNINSNTDPITGNPLRGDMEDVVACLNYNIEGYDFANNALNFVGTNQGNDYRFNQCGQSCSFEDCFELPRSLIPSAIYAPKDYAATATAADPAAPGNFVDMKLFQNCLNNCSAQNCTVEPGIPPSSFWKLPLVHTGNPVLDYSYPPPGQLDPDPVTGDCAPANWQAGASPWYDAIVQNIADITPPTDNDIALFMNCINSCDATNCSAATLPPGPPYNYPAGPVDCSTWGPGNIWYDEIVANLILANPSCDLNPGGWLVQTRQSALEAQNQVEKFKKRRDFLQSRVDEIDAMINPLDGVLSVGHQKIDEFLTGPAKDLIDQRIAVENVKDSSSLPDKVIYAWQSEPPKDGSRIDGYWHVVRVEASSPLRCDGGCGWSTNKEGEAFPRIITETNSSGTERCYKLINTEGWVRMRVTRFDENRDSNVLRFPNGVPIWDFTFQNPSRPKISTTQTTRLKGTCGGDCCGDLVISDPPCGDYPLRPCGDPQYKDIYKGAVLMNEKITSDKDPFFGNTAASRVNKTCWELASTVLYSGVASQTCARYYYHPGVNKGIGFHFRDCGDSGDGFARPFP